MPFAGWLAALNRRYSDFVRCISSFPWIQCIVSNNIDACAMHGVHMCTYIFDVVKLLTNLFSFCTVLFFLNRTLFCLVRISLSLSPFLLVVIRLFCLFVCLSDVRSVGLYLALFWIVCHTYIRCDLSYVFDHFARFFSSVANGISNMRSALVIDSKSNHLFIKLAFIVH